MTIRIAPVFSFYRTRIEHICALLNIDTVSIEMLDRSYCTASGEFISVSPDEARLFNMSVERIFAHELRHAHQVKSGRLQAVGWFGASWDLDANVWAQWYIDTHAPDTETEAQKQQHYSERIASVLQTKAA